VLGPGVSSFYSLPEKHPAFYLFSALLIFWLLFRVPKNNLNYFFKKFDKSNWALFTLLHRPTQAARTAAAF
jgi:hypothetical protein